MPNTFSDEDLKRLRSQPNANSVPALVDEVTRLYSLARDERVKRAERFVERLQADVNAYHDHKETMAHAGLLVMIAVVGGIVSFKQWPPEWVPVLQVSIEQQTIAVLSCVLLWFIIHLYIRWQLRRRRWAASVYNGAVRAIAEWFRRDPAAEDLICDMPAAKSHAVVTCLLTVIDFVVPCPKAPLDDLWSEHFPSWFARAVSVEKVGSALGAVKAEWLVTLGSYLLLAILILRTWWS